MKLKNLLLRRVGNSYGFIVPKAIVENTNLLDNVRYDLELIPISKYQKLNKETSPLSEGPVVYGGVTDFFFMAQLGVEA